MGLMALRLVGHLRSLLGGLRGSAMYATSTTPKAKAYAPTADYGHFQDHKGRKTRAVLKGDFVPVYVAVGMIALSVSLGLLTAKHQILYSPGVRVKKKTRETLLEVEDPDKVLDESERFLKKSFFRKVAHVQEFDHVVPGPIRKDVFACIPKAEALESVGIDPTQQ
ncbi:hypothetical protein Ddye_000745 [Dipteronia dyeriana]|uniref:Uncharacterized protein n=1 Tax=Dipteronia dyeriana TaxID=168575 RepID=A0AAE0CSV0_9ROSI|nr:hypothetical protein Ddye_000745 [Dipteronia dyeriana]